MERIEGYQLNEPVGRIGLLVARPATHDTLPVALVLQGDAPGAHHSLERVAAAHARIDSPRVPKVLAHGPGYLVLDVDAVGTTESLLRKVPRASVPYVEGIAVTLAVVEALAAAHEAGQTIGTIGPTNVVLTRTGRLMLVGFGGMIVGDGAAAHPNVAAGAAPTPATDVYAAMMFVRSLAPYVAGLPAQLAHLLGGGAIGSRFSRAMFRALTASGDLDGGRAIAVLRALWRTLGVVPDEDALGARLLEAERGRVPTHLFVGASAAWFEIDRGPRVDLSLKRAQRAILAALVDAHETGARLGVPELVAVGWPGEQLKGTSGPDRFYTAIASLRSAGLRDVVDRNDAGYCINPRVVVRRAG